MDGARVRAARVLLPRDRPQPARGRAVPRAGRDLRRRRRRRARRARRSCSRPTARRPRSSRRPAPRAATSSTRCARSSPRCTTRRRSAPARASRSSTSATPATTKRSARSRSRPTSIRLVERDDDLDAAARARSTTRHAGRDARADDARARRVDRACSTQARDAVPATLWTASRNDLCFATTNRQAALTAIADRADAVVVIGSANSSNTIALDEGRARRRLPDRAAGRRPRRARPRPRSATRAIVGVTAGASAPEELVDAVIAKLAPDARRRAVRVTDEDEYFPPPRELRELIPALDARRRVRVRRRSERARARPADRSPTTARSTRPRCSPASDG